MPISASRIYHVNTNTRELGAALAFYRDALGFTAATQPKPSGPQPGGAFGLDEVLWDGYILHGDLQQKGLSLDLLQWEIPPTGGEPPRTYHEPGYHRLCFVIPSIDDVVAHGARLLSRSEDAAIVADPDGVPVELREGPQRHISHVVVNCRDLDASFAYYRDVMGLVVLHEPQPAPHLGSLAYGLGGIGDVRDTGTAVAGRTARLRDRGSDFAVELVGFDTPAMPPLRARRANDAGLFRMAWSTRACSADEAVVRAAGSVPFSATGELSVGDHLPLLRVLFWPGPDGECLELIEIIVA